MLCFDFGPHCFDVAVCAGLFGELFEFVFGVLLEWSGCGGELFPECLSGGMVLGLGIECFGHPSAFAERNGAFLLAL